jgi:hypothetical protein
MHGAQRLHESVLDPGNNKALGASRPLRRPTGAPLLSSREGGKSGGHIAESQAASAEISCGVSDFIRSVMPGLLLRAPL